MATYSELFTRNFICIGLFKYPMPADFSYAYYKNSCHADEVRQRLYVRMFGIYCEKFKIERYIGADGFYVENWRTMDREELLLEYVKYLKERPERM